MTWKTRLTLRESAGTALAFTFAVYFYYVTVFWGLQDYLLEGPIKDYMLSRAVHVEFLMGGILFGGLIGIINRFTESLGARQKSFGQVVLIMTLMNLLTLAVVAAAIILVVLTFVLSWQEFTNIATDITATYLVSIIVWQVFVVWTINFWLEIQRVIGSENLRRLITGRFRRPREETRVFLFMDLKGSTELAERLGHLRYSEMLQECFRDLTQVALRYEAAIYQYVGDEVVMSWPRLRRDDFRRNSVQAFFAYEQELALKKEEYRLRFGVEPEFRGGIDEGAVMATEVGDVKREIVFHGDVLNTAARLLELCKHREERLVVSDSIGKAVEEDAAYRTNWTEEVSLRGKTEQVKAYSLQVC